jgi:hypothetical protein
MTSYKQAIDVNLFNASSSSSYKVNPLFTNLTSLDAAVFDSTAQADTYLKLISSLSLQFKKEIEMTSWLDGKLNSRPANYDAFSADDNAGTVTIDLLPAANDKYNGRYIQEMLVSMIGGSQVLIKDNKSFVDFVKNILEAITRPIFSDAMRQKFPSSPTVLAVLAKVPRNQSFVAAHECIQTMSVMRIANLYSALQYSVANVLKSRIASRVATSSFDFISEFNDLSKMTPTTTSYYSLRNDIINDFEITADMFVNAPTSVHGFLKEILVEMYLKTCYPMVQLTYIDCLRAAYESSGDFVNLRFAMLSHAIFAYCWIRKLLEVSNAAITASERASRFLSNTTKELESLQPSIPQEMLAIAVNMAKYLTNLNITFKTNEPLKQISSTDNYSTSTRDMVADMRRLTNSVQVDSQNISRKQQEILRTQVSIRTYSESLKDIQALYASRIIEFYIVTIVVFLAIVIWTLLILLKQPHIAAISAATLIVVVLCFKLMMMIYNYFFK